jgi:hypothetical protein
MTSERKPDMVFLSHANPEDNDFARWLALQLANEGYPVWCDLTKLLGGEKFWEDIQNAITNRTVKFVFALSRHSNQKSGTLDELNCALAVEKKFKLKDFVITLKMDDLSFDDVYINIQRRNHIDFACSWASGASQLLKKFADDQVPKNPQFSPQAVSSWWRTHNEFSAEQGLLQEPDQHLSNWFLIEGLPLHINRHLVSRDKIGKIEFDPAMFSHPSALDTDISFLSFADAKHFIGQLPSNHIIAGTEKYSLQSIRDRTAPRGYPALLTSILRLAWERKMQQTVLSVYELSNRAKCFYFLLGQIPDNRLFFESVEGKRTYRDIVGYATRLERRRHWHYGINAKPVLQPVPHYVIKGHVVFSDDGLKLWDSKERLAKARRNQCKNWWNDEWRDRMLAVMTYLANEQQQILLPLAPDLNIELSARPELFESPISYVDPADIVKEEELDDYSFEEDEDELENTDPDGEPEEPPSDASGGGNP